MTDIERAPEKPIPGEFNYHGLIMNPLKLTASHGKEIAHFTLYEWRLLRLLADKDGRFVDKDTMVSDLYKYEPKPASNSVAVLLSGIREKLDTITKEHRIATIRNKGYALEYKMRDHS